jgi:hypothetical protein
MDFHNRGCRLLKKIKIKNIVNGWLSLLLIVDFSLNLQAKVTPKQGLVAAPVKAISEEQIMQRFVEVWNSSENVQDLLQQFKIEANALNRITKDLQNEKILKLKPPELEYSPRYHSVLMRLHGQQEKMLILSKSSLNGKKKPIIYSGFKFHQIDDNSKIADTYFKIKLALQQTAGVEVNKREKNTGSKKKKNVSMLELLLGTTLVTANAEVVSVPFAGKKEEKTNWVPWIALGSAFGLLALWKGFDYFFLNNNAKADTDSTANSGANVNPPPTVKDEDREIQESPSQQDQSQLEGIKPTGQDAPARSDATTEQLSTDLSKLQPIAEIDKNLKQLELSEQLRTKRLFCDGADKHSIVLERTDSNPLETYAVTQDKNEIRYGLHFAGDGKINCKYIYADNRFVTTSKNIDICAKDRERNLAFTQEQTFKQLQESIDKCCPDVDCRTNLLSFMGEQASTSSAQAPAASPQGSNAQ